MYKTYTILVRSTNKEFLKYCSDNCQMAKLFRNSVIFRCRQLITAHYKLLEGKALTDNEKQVLDEIKVLETKFPKLKEKTPFMLSANQFEHLFKLTDNPDFRNVVSSHSAAQMIQTVLSDFKSFWKAMKIYKVNPSAFTGKPELPSYCKSKETTVTFTNQVCTIKDTDEGRFLAFPKTKLKLPLGSLELGTLKEVEIMPYYNTYKITIVTEIDNTNFIETLDYSKCIGIDMGVQNIITTSNNFGVSPFIVKGNVLKSFNQWCNKKLSHMQSELPQGIHTSWQIRQLMQYRNNYITDYFNKIASKVISYAVEQNVGVIIIGINHGWKQNVNNGKVNNQTFCYIPHSELADKIQSIGASYGIQVEIVEESYTSQASSIDGDTIPTYIKGDKTKYTFSGKRTKRGLYKTREGIKMNADVNGATNIIRKHVPFAFDKITDFGYLTKQVKTLAC